VSDFPRTTPYTQPLGLSPVPLAAPPILRALK
jgi:hypothetical protein